jgi:hypothetical protein
VAATESTRSYLRDQTDDSQHHRLDRPVGGIGQCRPPGVLSTRFSCEHAERDLIRRAKHHNMHKPFGCERPQLGLSDERCNGVQIASLRVVGFPG